MSTISSVASAEAGPGSSSGIGNGGCRKGRPKLTELMKRKQLNDKVKMADNMTSSGSSSSGSKTAKGTPKKKHQSKGSKNGSESDSEEDDIEEVVEELFEVTYLNDYIDAVELVDDLARQNSQLLEVHCEQVGWLERIENEMSKLLGNEDEDELEPGRLNGEKKKALQNLEDMLVHVSRTGDRGVQTTDEVETIIEAKLRTLNIDHNNLAAQRSKLNSGADATNASDRSSRNLKKPSLNPRSRGTPNKVNSSSKMDDNEFLKLPFATLSLAGTTSPTPSFMSSSSCDNKSGKDSQTPVDVLQFDDTRYRACKYRNPPNYVFNARILPTAVTSSATPKKADEHSQKKADEDGGRSEQTITKMTGKVSKRKRSISTHSQGSNQKQSQSQGGAESGEDSWCDSSSSSGRSGTGGSTPEPTYCLCEKVSHGRMVQCDNGLCPIEWFHFGCINLKKNPKGDWFCPRCRGENSAVMKPKAEFLKELAQYNKEKEKES